MSDFKWICFIISFLFLVAGHVDIALGFALFGWLFGERG